MARTTRSAVEVTAETESSGTDQTREGIRSRRENRPRKGSPPTGTPGSGASTDVTSDSQEELESETARPETCPECGGDISASGVETTCGECGLVVSEDRIDRGPEWRTFSHEDRQNRRRTGPARTVMRHDRGLSTRIGRGRDAKGNTLSGKTQRRFSRLRTQQKQTKIESKQDRNRAYAFTDVRRVTGALGLPKTVAEQACTLLDDAFDENEVLGRDLDGFVGAAVYAACRMQELGRTYEEIASVARADPATISGTYRVLNTYFELAVAPPTPDLYLGRVASEVSVSTEKRLLAEDLLGEIDQQTIQGRNPAGVAAAVLYLVDQQVGEQVLTQSELAEAAHVTPMTVREVRDALVEDGAEVILSLCALAREMSAPLTGEDRDVAMRVAVSLDEEVLEGRTPTAVAGAILYLVDQHVGEQAFSQSDLADVAGMDLEQIRESYDALRGSGVALGSRYGFGLGVQSSSTSSRSQSTSGQWGSQASSSTGVSVADD